MKLQTLDLNFLFKSDVNYYGEDSYGRSIYTYHDLYFVDFNGELIPYINIDED